MHPKKIAQVLLDNTISFTEKERMIFGSNSRRASRLREPPVIDSSNNNSNNNIKESQIYLNKKVIKNAKSIKTSKNLSTLREKLNLS